MKLNDIIVESKPVTEAPMGMLSKAGNKVMSKFGSGKATGKLDAGATANALRKEFDVYLGKTGSEPDAQTVISFLQQKGWPTKGAEQILQGTNTKGPGTDQGQPQAQAGANQAQQQTNPTQQAEPKQQGNPQPQGRIDPTMDPIEPAGNAAPEAPADGGATAQPKGGLPGMDMKAPSNPNQKLDPKTVAAKKAELLARRGKQNSQGTTKSGFGNYVKQASGQRITGANPDGSPKITKINAGMYEAAGALPSSIIDKAFLRAVQDGNKLGGGQGQQQSAQGGGTQQGGGQGQQSQDNGDQSGGQPGAWDTFKQNAGMGKSKPGQADPNAERKGALNANQLATLLPNVDPAQLKRASNVVLQGGKLNQQMLGVLGQAFGEVLKADPQVTMKIMTILKKVEA